ncbi:hypothetical protein N3930_21435, partial [Bacillus thuringiensis]|nr:hypothetical protein [Bacillus thuringiensis]
IIFPPQKVSYISFQSFMRTSFEKEELFDCIQEYTERLADKFYYENNHEKSSEYYHMSKEARKKQMIKGALK